jgi:hypothetical protein
VPYSAQLKRLPIEVPAAFAAGSAATFKIEKVAIKS